MPLIAAISEVSTDSKVVEIAGAFEPLYSLS
jgi:hypothetical protein